MLQHEHPWSLLPSPSWESPGLPCSIPDVPVAMGFQPRWVRHHRRCRSPVKPCLLTQIHSYFLFFSWLTRLNKEGSSGHAQSTNSPWRKAARRLFVQILPARMLFDVFKGAILMLRKEGKRRLDEARRSKPFFAQKSAGLGLKNRYILFFIG